MRESPIRTRPGVSPRTGEWIEIEIQNIKCVELKSPPVREEWIEIAKKKLDQGNDFENLRINMPRLSVYPCYDPYIQQIRLPMHIFA